MEFDRFRLIGGPYAAPNVPVGGNLYCELRREMIPVAGYTDAPIPWPRGKVGRRKGSAPIVVCGDLIRALKSESGKAIAFNWGTSSQRVRLWKRAVGAEAFTEGSRKLLQRISSRRWTSHRSSLVNHNFKGV